MDRFNAKKKFLALAVLLVFALSIVSCGRQGDNADEAAITETPESTEENADQTGSAEAGGIPISVDNDTVELGTLDTFTPSDDIDANSGTAIAGSEEEQLQQERIAGGAVGGVVSENLEPLNGITDYSEGEYEPVYGVTVE